MSRVLTFLGIVVSLLYLYFIAQYFDFSVIKIKELKPNTLGDFLAGTFAPLAFLWLVLGYFQQGKALQTQIEELRETVQHQEAVAKTAKARCDPIFRQSDPIQFHEYSYGHSTYATHYIVRVTFENVGEAVTGLSLYFEGKNQGKAHTYEVIDTNEKFTIQITNPFGKPVENLSVLVLCKTILKETYPKKYLIVNNDPSIIPKDIESARALDISIEEVND